MKKLIYYLFLFLFFLKTSCITKENRTYPELIKANQLEQLYDSAKWIIYASNHRIDTIICMDNPDTLKYLNLSVVSLDLYLDTLLLKGDTTIMEFYFYKENNCNYCTTIPNSLNKLLFVKEDSIIYRMNSDYGYNQEFLSKIQLNETKGLWVSEYFKPYKLDIYLFPKYLKEHDNNLNTWLKEEALKRDVLDK